MTVCFDIFEDLRFRDGVELNLYLHISRPSTQYRVFNNLFLKNRNRVVNGVSRAIIFNLRPRKIQLCRSKLTVAMNCPTRRSIRRRKVI